MKYFCSFLLLFVCAFSLSSLSSVAYAMGGAGGSWGDDSGFGGNGGSMGGSGSGANWGDDCDFIANSGGSTFTGKTALATCTAYTSQSGYITRNISVPEGGGTCTWQYSQYGDSWNSAYGLNVQKDPSCVPKPECPVGQHYENSVCVPDLKCPAGYVKDGNKCIWQCPVGYKMLGGNCVKDDMPEDCDPAIQQCDEDGKPVCDCCASLKQLVNQNNTIINNDNRIISLTETSVSNQNTIINNTENINNNISNVNNNITTTNNKLDQLIQTINDNNPNFDTSALEAKLDELIAKDMTVDGAILELDWTELFEVLDNMNETIKANKYDDTELKAKLDELINKDLSEVTNRQDEQTGLLEQIRDLLRPVEQAELAPSLENEPFEARLDPWSAIRGFDVNQNMINAQAQCPSGDAYSFQFFGQHFAMPMSILCGYLGQLGVGFMFLAYMGGAFIIVKGD